MQANSESQCFRSALISECKADLESRLTALLEAARVYGHAFVCPDCRHHCPHIAGVLADVARHVGNTIRGFEIVNVDTERVVELRPKELASLVRLCGAGTSVGSDECAETEWRTALEMSALTVALAIERKSRTEPRAWYRCST